MYRIDLNIALTVQAPFMTQSTAPGEYGIDSALARNSEGKIYIPGSLVVGQLREAWEELREALQGDPTDEVPSDVIAIDRLLGAKLSDGEYIPKAKRLFFNDFLFRGEVSKGTHRYRVEIDQTRGAVGDGQLMSLESPFAAGEFLVFDGTLSFTISNQFEGDRIRRQVLCGLQWFSQTGAFRTIGFGRVIEVEVGAPIAREVIVQTGNWPDAGGFDLVLKPEAPFCIAERPRSGNIFESREEIPGAVIKGCIARTIDQLVGQTSTNTATASTSPTVLQQLRKNFSAIRISHAFPSSTCFIRPVKPPLSLVKANGLYDVALMDSPVLINDRAPEFSIDWKEDSDVKERFGWPHLARELRVRTAINREKLRHQDEALFAYEMIVPGGHCWLAHVDASGVEDAKERSQVLDQLAAVLEPGLLGLGKSKIAVKSIIQPAGAVENAHDIGRIDDRLGVDGKLVITLQTPALLLDPQPLAKHSDAATLFKGYFEAWRELSPSLELDHFFARQILSGGRYQHGRFQVGKNYRPWLLTVAGSVFVFKINKEGMESKLKTWLTGGLPLPPSVCMAYGLVQDDIDTQWKNCPFIPQNGFGEIAINLKVHEELFPPDERCRPIARTDKREVICG